MRRDPLSRRLFTLGRCPCHRKCQLASSPLYVCRVFVQVRQQLLWTIHVASELATRKMRQKSIAYCVYRIRAGVQRMFISHCLKIIWDNKIPACRVADLASNSPNRQLAKRPRADLARIGETAANIPCGMMVGVWAMMMLLHRQVFPRGSDSRGQPHCTARLLLGPPAMFLDGAARRFFIFGRAIHAEQIDGSRSRVNIDRGNISFGNLQRGPSSNWDGNGSSRTISLFRNIALSMAQSSCFRLYAH